MGFRRALSLAAIYVVALHTILLGVVPVPAVSVVDASLSIICHSDVEAVAPVAQSPGRPDIIPGHACDHCILCSASAAPMLREVFAGQLVPTRLVQVLRPGSTSVRSRLAITLHLARGPPIFA